jgi:hypothetical protein
MDDEYKFPIRRKAPSMIELTLEQRQAVARQEETPLRVIDRDTQVTYVLIREEMYDRLKSLFATDDDTQFARDMYAQAMEVFGRDGWDDPAMDVYNELDPRRPS